ncbi:MAG: 50S ribosomal protein L11 methyltransferase [Gammaproteobacteria bacterium]|nr:50S ribosomal protein L11 methyltransferase [Gammaproteobacteria bacterium]
MPWLQLKLRTQKAAADALSDRLSDLGADAVTYLDAEDQPILEPGPGETPLWSEVVVVGLWDAEADMDSVLLELAADPLWAKVEHSALEPLEDKDWIREWMDQFHPIRFGQRLWIVPSWREAPDPSAVNILLDPGLAFGTGTHPTTALCLEYLDDLAARGVLAGQSCIDFGCGSGILAIAGLKLGAAHFVGVDNDPQAILATRENAARNSVPESALDIVLPPQFSDAPADGLVANILAGPLRELAPRFASLVKPGGWLALSGILESQAEELLAIYGQWFEMDPPALREEWVRLSGTRRA